MVGDSDELMCDSERFASVDDVKATKLKENKRKT